MSIGAGIFLMTVGAIFAFGIRDDSGTVDLNVVGVVIMLAGAAGICLSYYITNRRRRVETDAIDPVVEEEYRTVQASLADEHPSTTPPKADAPSRPITVTRETTTHETTARSDRPAVSRTERHIDLDPTANGLHTPTPYRSAPAPEPVAADLDQSRTGSWRKQLRGRLKRPHLPTRHGNR